MKRLRGYSHPFRLLLYLEWILLGIAILAVFTPARSPFLHPPPWEHQTRFEPQNREERVVREERSPVFGQRDVRPDHAPPIPRPHHHDGFFSRMRNPLAALISVGVLGVLGLRLPIQQNDTRLMQGVYTGLGFVLCWLAALLSGGEANFFSALLLVVVIRACLLFPQRGRIVVALLAYGSFLALLLLQLRALDSPIDRPNLDPDMVADFIRPVILTFLFNAALLFGLVLLFVLLLVGALVGERQSHRELAQANQRLREYAMLVEDQAILQERNRIAREIHDSVGHNLTAQSIQLENASMFLVADTDKAHRYLQKARQLGADALRDVRQSIAALRSHPLKGQSLQEALLKLITAFQQTTPLSVESHIRLTTTPPTEVAIALYRIIQEAFTNIAKHSEATQVRLGLTESATGYELTIADNGNGFTPEENTTGFGLQGMRERSNALGGQFRLESHPAQGCTIHVDIPHPSKS